MVRIEEVVFTLMVAGPIVFFIVVNGLTARKCSECEGRVWLVQRKVHSLDGNLVAHRKCKPEGYHGERKM